MTITGLDLSLRATGWCRLGGGLDPQDPATFGTISPPKGMTGLPRLVWLSDKIGGVADQLLRSRHCFAVIEGFSFGSRGKAVYEIAGLGYLVRYELYRRGMPFVVVPPAMLKKFVCGKGTAQKSLMIREVYRRWSIEVKDDNEADAVGLAHLGAALLGHLTGMTAFQSEVLTRLRKGPEVQQTLARVAKP